MIRREEREYTKGVMKGVIKEREEGHGKGLLLWGVEALFRSLCEIMFPLCNVKASKARLLTSKGALAAQEIGTVWRFLCGKVGDCVCWCAF